MADSTTGRERGGSSFPTAPYISRAPANRLWHDGAAELPGTAGTARDLSGRFSLRWDEGWIYLAASVSDNVHDVAGGDDQDWYFKDSVSLFLDVPNDGDGSDWIAGDHAFSFVADPSYPAHGRWWRYGAAAGRQLEEPAPAQTRLAVRMTSDTDYDLEAAIPMSALTRLTSSWTPPYAGRTVGFLVLVTDPDGGRTPFGGQLNYPGDGDDDGELRFSARETAAPPHIELPVDTVDLKTPIELDLIHGRVVSGKPGEPYGDLQLHAYRDGLPSGEAVTDEAGEFRVLALPGEYTLMPVRGQGVAESELPTFSLAKNDSIRVDLEVRPDPYYARVAFTVAEERIPWFVNDYRDRIDAVLRTHGSDPAIATSAPKGVFAWSSSCRGFCPPPRRNGHSTGIRFGRLHHVHDRRWIGPRLGADAPARQ